MSIKAMSLVWDMQCPNQWTNTQFVASHKFVLLAYADHADHQSKSIYPAVETIAHKTGLSERTVQRLTRDLETMGILLNDGTGPKGTNRWRISLSDRGDMVTPLLGDMVTPLNDGGGDIHDILLGDIPSGDMVTPELTNNQDIYIYLEKVFCSNAWWQKYKKETGKAKYQVVGGAIVVSGLGRQAEVINDRYGQTIRRMLPATQYQAILFTE